MQSFVTLNAVAAPLAITNIDTDRIIPGRFLTYPRDAGLGKFAFYDLRHDTDGNPRPEFPLNQDAYRGTRILVADDNFGCGSSRESAVWALVDLDNGTPDSPGIRAVIAPRFGDIFFTNACKNGLLPVRLATAVVADLRRQVGERPGATITIDLPEQSVVGPDGGRHSFDIDPFLKECLVKGIDDIQLTLEHLGALEAYESQRTGESSWLTPDNDPGQ